MEYGRHKSASQGLVGKCSSGHEKVRHCAGMVSHVVETRTWNW